MIILTKETKLKIVQSKLFATFAMMFYSIFVNAPMIAYTFYKVSDVKWLAILCIIVGLILVSICSYLWIKIFWGLESAYGSQLNPEWNTLREDIRSIVREELNR